MKFYAVARTKQQAQTEPPVQQEITQRVMALHVTGGNPIVFKRNGVPPLDPIPGFEEAWQVIFFNEDAWQGCKGLGFALTAMVDESEIPENSVKLVGP
jgi:hypothetical protein